MLVTVSVSTFNAGNVTVGMANGVRSNSAMTTFVKFNIISVIISMKNAKWTVAVRRLLDSLLWWGRVWPHIASS